MLIDNFNDRDDLQGLGSTIVIWRPTTRAAQPVRRHPPQPAAMPRRRWPHHSDDHAQIRLGDRRQPAEGTTKTKGPGCLIVLDVNSNVAAPSPARPWGNMAVIDNGATATLLVSNTGFDVGPPDDEPPAVNKATVLRIELSVADGKPPVVTRQTVIGGGFGEQADKDMFIIGPTGLALGKGGVLYVSDALGNRIAAIPDAATRTDSAGTGREVTKDGLLKRPLAMTTAPNGHLLVTNGQNGQGGDRSGDRQCRSPHAGWTPTRHSCRARQRRSVRDHHDAVRRWVLLRGGRGECAGALSGRRSFLALGRRPVRCYRRGAPRPCDIGRPVRGRTSGRHRHAAADTDVFRGTRPDREEARRNCADAACAGPMPPRA